MKTFTRICIKDYSLTDSEGQTGTVQRGHEYLTSAVENGTVTVFTRYWFPVPVSHFGGEEPFT